MIFTRTNSKEHGLAAIEMMVILPILLLLLCAIFEVGRIFMHYTMLNKALQNGARYAVIDVYGTDRASLIADSNEIKTWLFLVIKRALQIIKPLTQFYQDCPHQIYQ